MIIDINKSADENFNSILNEIKNVLDKAVEPFLVSLDFKSVKEFIKAMRYDYNTLYITTVYGVLNLLSITYSEDLPKKKILENMPILNTATCSEEDKNRKRLPRIEKAYSKLLLPNMFYFNQFDNTPRLMATDALWYNLLSDFPRLRRFLFEEEAIISQNFFDELKSIYDAIDKYSGYDRFFLKQKLEMCSKLELFYKILSLIKKEKRRLKLSNRRVNQMIGNMYNLHIVPYKHHVFESILRNYPETEIYNEILAFPEDEITVNSIVLKTNEIAMYYIKSQVGATDFTALINFIHNAVVFHLCCKIERQLSISDNQEGFKLIKSIQHSGVATKYFDTYLQGVKRINFKNFKRDITFTHFKKIYNLKPERPKKIQ